jgi:hypothetical protein
VGIKDKSFKAIIIFTGRKHMMHLKPNKTGAADISEVSGFISTKQNSIISLTKLVVVISVILAVLMVVSR